MRLFTGQYYEHEGELYKKINPTRQGYYLRNKQGKRQWITMKKILEIIDNRNKKWYN